MLILFLFYQKQVMRIFKKNEHLQLHYENVEYIEILFTNKCGLVKLNDKTAIKKIVDILNGFELINEENREEKEVFTVYLYGNISPTAISFSENYLNFSDGECWECTSTEYYIAGSKFSDFKVEKFYNVLNELIDEYGEDE